MDEYPRVLLVSIRVMPGITDDWYFHLVTARSDLTEFDFAFSSKTPVTWQPGDMIPLHDAFLIPDSDRIGGAIAEEMLLYGSFVKEDEYDSAASGYLLSKEVDVMRGAYLRAIFRLILQAGIMLHVGGRDWRYIPDFDEDGAAQFQLGYLIAEYNWKYKHERAALSGYKAGQGLATGRKEAAKEKKRQGDLSRRAVAKCAREIVKLHPALSANTLGLAREIHKSASAPLKPDGSKLGVEAIREHLQRLKASGKLTISG
jgi:hypothetical protein